MAQKSYMLLKHCGEDQRELVDMHMQSLDALYNVVEGLDAHYHYGRYEIVMLDWETNKIVSLEDIVIEPRPSFAYALTGGLDHTLDLK